MSEATLTLDAGDNGGQIVFRDAREIRAWVEKEKNFWSWLFQARGSDGNIATPVDNMRRFLDQISAAGQEWEKNGTNATIVDQQHKRLTALFGELKTEKIIHSSSTNAQFIDHLKNKSVRTASYAYAWLVGHQIQNATTSEIVEGLVAAYLFKASIVGVADSERAAIEKIKREFNEEQQRLRTEQKDLLDQQLSLKQQTVTFLADQQARAQRFSEETKKAFDTQLANAKKELDDLKTAYEEHMSLKAPVKYWEHRSYYQAGFAALWIVILGSLSCVVLAYDLANINNILVQEKISIPRIGYTALTVTLFLWAIRIFVRLFLSSVHGFNDAQERALMVKTYLSLLKDGVAIKAEDRVFLLQHLFRPGSTGLVKDDAVPPVFEALGKIVNRA